MNDLIIKIEKDTRKVILEQIYIGNDHENLQENLIFQFDEFVNGQARLEYEINDTKNYIILQKNGETYEIPVQNVITIYQEDTMGKIKFQLVVTEGTETESVPVFKSNIFFLKCRPSINAVTEAPEGYDLWIEQANAILNEMDNIDIDITTEDESTKVVITRKDGTTKEATVSGGTGTITDVKVNNTSVVTSGIANIDLTGYIQDNNYVHTDNNYTTIEKNKLSELNNYDDTEIRGLIANKVDKVTGKGLSTNDYTTEEKQKLAGIDLSTKQDTLVSGTNIKTINNESILGSGNITIQGGGSETDVQINGTSITSGGTANIVTEGIYNATTNKIATVGDLPTVPTSLSQLSDDSTHRLVTDTEKSTWNGKQDTIDSSHKLSSDLVDDTNKTNKFVTTSEKTTWNAKQDALVSGTNIKTVNNESLLGSGNITIQGGGTEEDNVTITQNSQNKIQTIAVIDSNSGSADKVWIGTTQQYEAITNKDLNTIYYITDDSPVSVAWGGITGTLSNQTDLSTALGNKVDTSKVKNANSTTAGDVYDVRYINTMLGDIETLLGGI